jgi:hypothetical protein
MCFSMVKTTIWPNVSDACSQKATGDLFVVLGASGVEVDMFVGKRNISGMDKCYIHIYIHIYMFSLDLLLSGLTCFSTLGSNTHVQIRIHRSCANFIRKHIDGVTTTITNVAASTATTSFKDCVLGFVRVHLEPKGDQTGRFLAFVGAMFEGKCRFRGVRACRM